MRLVFEMNDIECHGGADHRQPDFLAAFGVAAAVRPRGRSSVHLGYFT